MERIHSLYLHVPFCTWVCKYCDFNAYAVLEGLIPPYVDALSCEIDVAAAERPIGPLETVFIGGGTPSLLTNAQVRQVLDSSRTRCASWNGFIQGRMRSGRFGRRGPAGSRMSVRICCLAFRA